MIITKLKPYWSLETNRMELAQDADFKAIQHLNRFVLNLMVEAAGIEPASEDASASEPTCVACWLCFAS